MKRTLAIITPTYKRDFDCCSLLCESIDKFVPEHITHYLFVDNADLKLFKTLENNRRKVLSTTYKLWYLFHLPFMIRWYNLWFSLFTFPVRGWILQQVVKLGVFDRLDEDFFLCLDSEFFFVKPFDENNLIQNDKIMLIRHPGEWKYRNAKKYYNVAANLLGMQKPNSWNAHYISPQFVFEKEVLSKLAEAISKNSLFGNWRHRLLNKKRFSEYMLYGIFVEYQLGIENSDHYFSEDFLAYKIGPYHYNHNLQELKLLIKNISMSSDQVGIYIQRQRSNKRGQEISAYDYKSEVYELWKRLNEGSQSYHSDSMSNLGKTKGKPQDVTAQPIPKIL